MRLGLKKWFTSLNYGIKLYILFQFVISFEYIKFSHVLKSVSYSVYKSLKTFRFYSYKNKINKKVLKVY